MSSNLNLQAETLGKLETMAQAAVAAEKRVAVVPLPLEPAGTYLLVAADGSHRKVLADPPPRKHTLCSVDQVIPAVERYKEFWQPSVWYSQAAVIVLLNDDADFRMEDRAVCALTPSREFAALRGFASNGQTLSQKQFVLALRTIFAEALGDQLDGLVRAIRSVTFANGSTGRSEVGRGRESVDRSVIAETKGNSEDIPQEVSLDLRVFDDPALKARFRIRAAVEIEAQTSQFSLIPLGDGLEGVLDDQMQAIGELFSGLDCPVFYGTP